MAETFKSFETRNVQSHLEPIHLSAFFNANCVTLCPFIYLEKAKAETSKSSALKLYPSLNGFSKSMCDYMPSYWCN